MPRKPTRSPGRRWSRSSASAAVSGSDTVPMFPRYSNVEKSFSAGMPSDFRIVSRCSVPTWWQITLSRWSARQPSLVRNACHVLVPRSTPYLSTAPASVAMNGVTTCRMPLSSAACTRPAARRVVEQPLGRRRSTLCQPHRHRLWNCGAFFVAPPSSCRRLRRRQLLVDHQHGHRPGPAGQRRHRLLEHVHRLRLRSSGR